MIPVGLSSSATVLVGNNIGSLDLVAAKFYGRLIVYVGLIWSTGTGLTVFLF